MNIDLDILYLKIQRIRRARMVRSKRQKVEKINLYFLSSGQKEYSFQSKKVKYLNII